MPGGYSQVSAVCVRCARHQAHLTHTPVYISFRKSVSRHQSQPLSPDVIQLKEMVSGFSPSRPFDHLEVVATLGVGGFGRVELVRHESDGQRLRLQFRLE